MKMPLLLWLSACSFSFYPFRFCTYPHGSCFVPIKFTTDTQVDAFSHGDFYCYLWKLLNKLTVGLNAASVAMSCTSTLLNRSSANWCKSYRTPWALASAITKCFNWIENAVLRIAKCNLCLSNKIIESMFRDFMTMPHQSMLSRRVNCWSQIVVNYKVACLGDQFELHNINKPTAILKRSVCPPVNRCVPSMHSPPFAENTMFHQFQPNKPGKVERFW